MECYKKTRPLPLENSHEEHPRIARFYLHDNLKTLALKRAHNFLNIVQNTLEDANFTVHIHSNSLHEYAHSWHRPGYSFFLMEKPTTPRGLCIRRNYIFPFWTIEHSEKRWNRPIVHVDIPNEQIDAEEALAFTHRWTNRLFGAGAQPAENDDFIYVPLQGRLLQHRSFQTCSPITMLSTACQFHSNRKVLYTLHPSENYTSQELNALEKLQYAHSNLSQSTAETAQLLKHCDHIVTQNSSVAFLGLFHQKAAALFAQSDFPHLASNAHQLGLEGALMQAKNIHKQRTPQDYANYLFWFLQHMSINAGHPSASHVIKKTLCAAGWPL